jgi:hypothetical protein
MFGGRLDLQNNVTGVVDKVLKNMLSDDLQRHREKTIASIQALREMTEMKGFTTTMVLTDLTSFRNLFIDAISRLADLPVDSKDIEFGQVKRRSVMTGQFIEDKLATIPEFSPLTNCLVKQKVQRPRVRAIGKRFYDELAKAMDQVD